jgi:preprotein translocase subunit YajC
MENLKKGDTVITSGGLYGKITGITDEAVTIEIAEKVRVKVSKSAVAGYAKGEQA